MIVFRLGNTRWNKDLSGEGARIAGGRWNKPGIPCIYTAASRALCTLEYSAHNELDNIRAALTITRYKIPDNKIEIFKQKDLPGNWRNWPHEEDPIEFGSNLLTTSGPLILAFPSAAIPQEYNYILNVRHPDFKEIVIDGVEAYNYDVRIKA